MYLGQVYFIIKKHKNVIAAVSLYFYTHTASINEEFIMHLYLNARVDVTSEPLRALATEVELSFRSANLWRELSN